MCMIYTMTGQLNNYSGLTPISPISIPMPGSVHGHANSSASQRQLFAFLPPYLEHITAERSLSLNTVISYQRDLTFFTNWFKLEQQNGRISSVAGTMPT